MSDLSKSKIDQVKNKINLVVISKNEIQVYLDYCISKYGSNFCDVLYNQDKPNYLNWNT